MFKLSFSQAVCHGICVCPEDSFKVFAFCLKILDPPCNLIRDAMTAAFALVTRRPRSPQDAGPLINVITWILLIASGLAVLTRLTTKRALGRRWGIDDAFVVAALVSLVEQFGCLEPDASPVHKYWVWSCCLYTNGKWVGRQLAASR
jgi:hypothetical protein